MPERPAHRTARGDHPRTCRRRQYNSFHHQPYKRVYVQIHILSYRHVHKHVGDMCVYAYKYICMYMWLFSFLCIHTYLHACRQTDRQTDRHAYIPTYLPTCMHTHTYTLGLCVLMANVVYSFIDRAPSLSRSSTITGNLAVLTSPIQWHKRWRRPRDCPLRNWRVGSAAAQCVYPLERGKNHRAPAFRPRAVLLIAFSLLMWSPERYLKTALSRSGFNKDIPVLQRGFRAGKARNLESRAQRDSN